MNRLNKHRLLATFMVLAIILANGCHKDEIDFSAQNADGIFIAPFTAGRSAEEINVIFSSEPTILNISMALYNQAKANVNVSLEVDESLIEVYNDLNGTSHQPLPAGSFTIDMADVVIAKGNKASDTVQVSVKSSYLQEGTHYLLPITISSVSGGGINLNPLSKNKFFIISGTFPNIAVDKPTEQSSTTAGGVSERAVDGNTNGDWGGGSLTHTIGIGEDWWQVDLEAVSPNISEIRIYNRTDCCGERLTNFYVLVSDSPITSSSLAEARAQEGVSSYYHDGTAGNSAQFTIGRSGRYIRVQQTSAQPLSMAEVQILGVL